MFKRFWKHRYGIYNIQNCRLTNSYCRNASIRSLSGSAGDCVSTIHRRQERIEKKNFHWKSLKLIRWQLGGKKKGGASLSTCQPHDKHAQAGERARTLIAPVRVRDRHQKSKKTHKHTMGRGRVLDGLVPHQYWPVRVCVCVCMCAPRGRARETDKKKKRAALSVKMMDVAFHRLTIAWQLTPKAAPPFLPNPPPPEATHTPRIHSSLREARNTIRQSAATQRPRGPGPAVTRPWKQKSVCFVRARWGKSAARHCGRLLSASSSCAALTRCVFVAPQTAVGGTECLFFTTPTRHAGGLAKGAAPTHNLMCNLHLSSPGAQSCYSSSRNPENTQTVGK